MGDRMASICKQYRLAASVFNFNFFRFGVVSFVIMDLIAAAGWLSFETRLVSATEIKCYVIWDDSLMLWRLLIARDTGFRARNCLTHLCYWKGSPWQPRDPRPFWSCWIGVWCGISVRRVLLFIMERLGGRPGGGIGVFSIRFSLDSAADDRACVNREGRLHGVLKRLGYGLVIWISGIRITWMGGATVNETLSLIISTDMLWGTLSARIKALC